MVLNNTLHYDEAFHLRKYLKTSENSGTSFPFLLDQHTWASPPPCFHHLRSQIWAYPDSNEARGTLSHHHKACMLMSHKDLFPLGRPFATISIFSHLLLVLRLFPTQTSRAPYAIAATSQASQHKLLEVISTDKPTL